jgi:hypothetical protein
MPGSTRAASSVCRSIFFSKGLKGERTSNFHKKMRDKFRSFLY